MPTSRSTPTRSSAPATSRHVDEAMAEYIASADFDRLLVETVMRAFPPHEHEQFVAHYRGLLGAWVADQRSVS